jgi:hypothetical protein
MKTIVQTICSIFLLAVSAAAANYTVKSDGGGNYTTIQACANAMAAGDTCTVYAGTYHENVTVSAGTVGNYKTIQANGTDVVYVNGFTINSHDKIMGNCPISGAYGTCGFSLGNPSSPNGTCVNGTNNMTDYYIVGNTMEACTFIVTGPNGSNSSDGYILQNTMRYSCSTPNAPNVCTAGQLRGNYILLDNNDISHVSDGFYIAGAHVIFRRTKFHDITSNDCGSNSSNCHVDFMQADANYQGGALPAQYLVFENNSVTNMNGSDMHAVGLFQGEVCSGHCFNAIVRFHKVNNVTGPGIVDDNSEASCPAWDHVKSYNNDWLNMTVGSGGIINNTSYCSTHAAYVNDIYYWPGTVSNINAYSTVGGGGSNTSPYTVGNNLAYCPGCTASSVHAHVYGSGSWTDDTGNVLSNPNFVSYSANNFNLSGGSPAIGTGTHLTTVSSSDTGTGTTLVLNDADYFQAGFPLAGVQSDCIAVDTIANHVCLTAVNYSTNTVTLANNITRTSGSKVYIYSISDGTVVWTNGLSSPDLGAFPYGSSTSSQPAPPTDLTAIVH